MPRPLPGSLGTFSERPESNLTSHDTTISTAQDARNATKTHIPREERSK